MGILRFFKLHEKQQQQEVVEKVEKPSSVTTITATKGQYEGCMIEFDGNIIIGRDPSCSELIIDSAGVSRKHCVVNYKPEDQQYIVTDYSTNGTFIGKDRIEKGTCRVVPRGTFIIIGQSGNNFRLD